MRPTEDLNKKLIRYLDENGIKHHWFSEKIGISKGALSFFLRGKAKLPKKCWEKVIVVTKGYITMEELFYDFLKANKEE